MSPKYKGSCNQRLAKIKLGSGRMGERGVGCADDSECGSTEGIN